MKKQWSFSICVLLLITVLLSGCGKDNTTTSGNGQGGTTLSYSEAMKVGDYEAAYKALLSGGEGTNPADLDKFLVLPATVACDDRDGKFTATFTYSDKGLLTKVDIPKATTPEIITFTYDDNGRIKTKSHQKGSNATDVTTYTYDQNGNLLKDETEYYSGRKVTIDYTYDEAGRIVTDTTCSGYSFESEKEIDTYHSVYDANGNLLSRKTEDNYGSEYTYDEENRLLTECDVYGEDGIRNLKTYTYQDGRVVKERWESLSDAEWWTEKTFAYDANGTKYTTLYSDGGDTEAYTYSQTFDESGRITSYTYTERDDNEQRVNSYDAAGNIVRVVSTKNGAQAYTYTFEYDQFGNRTHEAYESSNGNYAYTATYTVKYYPNGAPEISDYVRDFVETDSFRYFF